LEQPVKRKEGQKEEQKEEQREEQAVHRYRYLLSQLILAVVTTAGKQASHVVA
jgi:hypothetical protein